MSSEDQEALFRPFRRTEAVCRRKQKGWSLGLTLVRGIAEAHGGSVRVESWPETGTTFYVNLPLDSRSRQEVKKSDLNAAILEQATLIRGRFFRAAFWVFQAS